MTGGGFGGCAVALVAAQKVEAFVEAVAACYQEKTAQGTEPLCLRSDGRGANAAFKLNKSKSAGRKQLERTT